MFNNFINFRDFLYVFEKGYKVFSLSWSLKKDDRVRKTWSRTTSPPTNWWNIPRVRQRWNEMVTGEANLPINDYFVGKYFSGASQLKGLSLGCGVGGRELLWAETGLFSHLDAYDLSPVRIESARKNAAESEFGHLVHFHVGDVMKIEVPEGFYDFVIVEGAMHHFSPLGEVLKKINIFLRQGGYLFINDFVGPTRFQWTDRQLQSVNALLDLLPQKYKKIWGEEKLKRDVYKHSRFGMIYMDPSEAVESASIVPLISQVFEIKEMKNYGGTLLHPMLNSIAHNFLSDDPKTQKWLDICFEVEDALMSEGDILSDYMVALCQKK